MCHSDLPPGQATPVVERREVQVPLTHGEAMPALLTSSGAGGPPVLVVADVFGRSPFYDHLASLLAEAGFRALLPDYFFREGPLPERTKEAALGRRAALDEQRTLRDLADAVDWLAAETGAGTVGTLGFCMGATLVLDLASTREGLATVAYYGFPAAPPAPKAPPRPLDLVDGLRGPVLAFWGDQDAAVGMESVEAYVAAAARSGARFRHRVLPGLGHGFLGAADLADADDPAAATWREAVGFLREQLAAA
jgi:carboxymethylenebutenolidase